MLHAGNFPINPVLQNDCQACRTNGTYQNLPAVMEPFVQSRQLPHDETCHQEAWKDSHSNNLQQDSRLIQDSVNDKPHGDHSHQVKGTQPDAKFST